MDLFSIWHWLIAGIVLLLLFGGRGKISDIMGDVAKGVKAFKKGLADSAEEHQWASDAPTRITTAQLTAEDKQHVASASKA